MSLAIVAAAIVALVVLVVWAKVHPFLAFILVSAGAAAALGMPLGNIAGAVRKGIGDILGSLSIVIVAGAMLGKLVVDSGAAQRIAAVLVAAFGQRRMAWAMALTGFIVGIPLFYGVGFMLLVPIIFAIVARYNLPAVVVGVPALAAMVAIQTDKLMAAGAQPAAALARELFSIRLLASGFIVTSLLWAGMVAALVDRRLLQAAAWCLAAAAFALFGVIHSPFADGRLFLPWATGPLPAEAAGRAPLSIAAAYALLAALFAAWHAWLASRTPSQNDR